MARYKYSHKTNTVAKVVTSFLVLALGGLLVWTNWGAVSKGACQVDHWARNTFGLEQRHQFDEGKIVDDPTCENEGTKLFTCTTCGEEELRTVEALGHTADEETVVIVDPTATETGTKTYTCLTCGESVTETLPIGGVHTPEEQDDGYAPTCTENGMTNTVSCADCGVVIEGQEEIPALGHNVVDGECDRCGYVDFAELYPGGYELVSLESGANLINRYLRLSPVGEDYEKMFTYTMITSYTSTVTVKEDGAYVGDSRFGAFGDFFVYEGYNYVHVNSSYFIGVHIMGSETVDVVEPITYDTEFTLWNVPASEDFSIQEGVLAFNGTGIVELTSKDVYNNFELTFRINEVTDVRGAMQIGFALPSVETSINDVAYVQFNYDRPVVFDVNGVAQDNYWTNGNEWTIKVVNGALTLSCENGVVCENVPLGIEGGYLMIRAENSCALSIHNLRVKVLADVIPETGEVEGDEIVTPPTEFPA